MFCLIELSLVWYGLFCFCNMGVLFDRTGFGLVWFVLFFCCCNIWVIILIDYNEFDEDKAGYWFRDWFAMSRNMTLFSGI